MGKRPLKTGQTQILFILYTWIRTISDILVTKSRFFPLTRRKNGDLVPCYKRFTPNGPDPYRFPSAKGWEKKFLHCDSPSVYPGYYILIGYQIKFFFFVNLFIYFCNSAKILVFFATYIGVFASESKQPIWNHIVNNDDISYLLISIYFGLYLAVLPPILATLA